MTSARVHIIIIGVLLSLLLSGCEEPVRQINYIELPISFAIPAGENYNSRLNAPARVPGDPGTFENFDKPTHAYFFIAFHRKISGNKDTIVSCIVDTTILESDWVDRDTIYYYNKTFTLEILDKEHVEDAHVYIAVSDTSLTLKNGGDVVDKADATYWPKSELEIQNLTFNVDDKMQAKLQHIYSSPYNYKPDDEHYYGRVSNIKSKVPYIHMMLYHVASKVDLMWNVPDSIRNDLKLRVTKVKVKNLFEGDAYLFKPTETSHAKFTGTGDEPNGYTPDDIAGDSPGTWWAGRSYFYTMAYQATDNKFPLQVEIEVQDMKTGGNPKKTFDMTLRKGGLDVFTPWMRGQFTITRMPDSDVESIDKEI